MNQFVPDWSNMGDASRTLGEDDNLIELLWCNGHVVMHSQNHRKLPPRPPEKALAAQGSAAAVAAAVQEDEAGLWFPFALADSLDKDIFSDLFYEAPVATATATATVAGVATGPGVVDGDGEGKPCRDDAAMAEGKRGGPCAVSEAPRDLMPPPKSTHASCSRQQTMSLADGGDNAGDLSELVRARTSGGVARKMEAGGASSSMLSAIGSSICGSNQVQVSSGSARRVSPGDTRNRSSKRKRLDTTEDSESPQRGHRVEVRGAGAQAAAEDDDGAEEPRRRGAQPLQEEETGQDQREDESPAGAHTTLQQD